MYPRGERAVRCAGPRGFYANAPGGGALDGVRLLSESTLREATTVHARGPDGVLVAPMRWRLGYHGVLRYHGYVRGAFGHYGYNGSGAWASPRDRAALAYVVNAGMGTPVGDVRMIKLTSTAMAACERVAAARPSRSLRASRKHDCAPRREPCAPVPLVIASRDARRVGSLDMGSFTRDPASGPQTGRYELGELIATGGMGSVHRAFDRLGQREVAYKRMRVAVEAHRPRITALFRREYDTLARLEHPNIVSVYEFGVDAQGPFYTMELVAGDDLAKRGPMPMREACRIARDVASALALVHARRLIHRDVSPNNVRLTVTDEASSSTSAR